MQRNAEKSAKLNFLSGQILDAAIEVHRVLVGQGCLNAYMKKPWPMN